MNELRFNNDANGYFDELPKRTQALVKELLEQYFNVDTWSSKVEEVECRSRDGFSPFSHNKGGLEISGFTTISNINGSGVFPAHKEARKEIERQVGQAYDDTAESVFERHEKLLTSLGLKQEDCRYHIIEDLQDKHPELSEVRRDIEDTEQSIMNDDNSTIMYSMRVMYHGCKGGVHSASVSAAVNTEGPYHRSHIAWAPGVFCEGAKEVEITWKTNASLKTKLEKTLKKLAKEVL